MSSTPPNEFSYLDKSLVDPHGLKFDVVCSVGYAVSGWAILWGRGKTSHVPVVTVFRGEEATHQEDAADLGDAKRIISSLERQIIDGTHPFT